MTDDKTTGHLAAMKGGGMVKSGQDPGAPVEVITAVLEVGFGTICHHFKNPSISTSKTSGAIGRV
jgi:hypothetical protein